MSRRPNANPPVRLAIAMPLLPHEHRTLQHNERSAAGNLGGYPRLENKLLELADEGGGICVLDPVVFTRMVCYLKRNYGTGGPNARVRAVCIPALRRIGIELLPEWRAPSWEEEDYG